MTNTDLAGFYEVAKAHVIACGYEKECRYYGSLSLTDITEQRFLSEYAWVVLNSGFRESIVRKKFDYLSLCFFDWTSAELISSSGDQCISLAMSCFGNRSKLQSIVNGTDIFVARGGLTWLRTVLTREHFRELEALPYIGPVTSRHLAKNLGVSLIKPDRHLARFESSIGRGLEAACMVMALSSGDNVRYVDSVLWRYFSLTAQ